MKDLLSRVWILIIAIFLLTNLTANAQFASNDGKKSKFMFAMGGGVGMAEMSGYSMLGGNIALELRKPLSHMGRNVSLSANLAVIGAFGNATVNQETKFDFLPASMLTLNINAGSQASPVAKNAFGGFLGVGLMVMAPKTVEYERFGESVSNTAGAAGPAIQFGPRFRAGKTYMDFRLYGGLTFGGDTEMTFGGASLMFTFGMNQKGRRDMY
jgi:hypothetical protein